MGKVFYWKIISILMLMFFLNGCIVGSSSSTSGEVKISKDFKMELVDVSHIGNAEAQYKLEMAKEINSTAVESSLDNMLDALVNIGSTDLNVSNMDTPIKVSIGEFYNIKVKFYTDKAYEDGLSYTFTLFGEDSNDSSGGFAKMIGSGVIEDINESGEIDLNVGILIDSEIKAGKYVFVVSLTSGEVAKGTGEQRKITESPELGGFFIEVEESAISQRVEIIDIDALKYIDLDYESKFINGYSNKEAGNSSLKLFNTSDKTQRLSISAKLELNTGEIIEIGLLDNNDSIVKNKVSYLLEVGNGAEIDKIVIDMAYYISEADYETLIKAIPDLSIDTTSDGLSGKIIWSIESDNSGLTTNSREQSVLLAKEIGSFQRDEIPEPDTKLERSMDTINSQYFIKTMGSSAGSWKSISNIRGLSFKSIDAAIDYNEKYAYFFAGKKYIKYDKNSNKIIGGPWNIKGNWGGISFNSIDAAFKTLGDEKIFFFSGDKYTKYDVSSRKIVRGYPKKIKTGFPGLEKLKSINAAINTYQNYVFFLGKDYHDNNVFMKYNLNTKRMLYGYPRNVTNTWSMLKNKSVSAAFYLKDGTRGAKNGKYVLFHSEDSALQSLVNDGVFFKYAGDYSYLKGKKKKVAISFDADYEAKGVWTVPGVSATANASAKAYLYNYSLKIIALEAEVTVSLAKKHPKADKNGRTQENKSRIGSKLEVIIMGGKIKDDDNIEEKTPYKTMSKNDSTRTKKADIKKAKDKAKYKGLKMPNYEWEEEKKFFSSRFLIGPIPMEVSGGIKGSIAIKTELGFEGAGVALTVSIPVDLGVYLKGGVNAAVVTAGIRGDGTLVEAGGTGKVRAGISLTDSNDYVFDINAKVKAKLKLVKASLSLYATAWSGVSCSWCCRCKKREVEYSHTFYATPWLYQRSFTFLDETIPIVKLPL